MITIILIRITITLAKIKEHLAIKDKFNYLLGAMKEHLAKIHNRKQNKNHRCYAIWDGTVALIWIVGIMAGIASFFLSSFSLLSPFSSFQA